MNFISKFKNLNNKMVKKMLIYTGIVVLVIVIAIIVVVILTKTVPYPEIERRMQNAAINFYKDNSELLPQTENGEVRIGLNELEEKYIKPIQKMVKKGVICNGEVRVIKNGEDYLYIPYLNCGDEYTTIELYKVITSENNIVTSGSGLYKQGDIYSFRGENVNNYVKFAGKVWRIIKIDENNNIKLIETEKRDSLPYDDRYNNDKGYNIGFNDFLVSRLYESLQKIYSNPENFNSIERASIVSSPLCIGKRDINETNNDGSVECSAKTDLEPLGLIQINEYINASLDQNCKKIGDASCQNYNYLHAYDKAWWTLTTDKSNSYGVYRIDTRGAEVVNASAYAAPRITLLINSNIIYKSGDGTQANPYVI